MDWTPHRPATWPRWVLATLPVSVPIWLIALAIGWPVVVPTGAQEAPRLLLELPLSPDCRAVLSRPYPAHGTALERSAFENCRVEFKAAVAEKLRADTMKKIGGEPPWK